MQANDKYHGSSSSTCLNTGCHGRHLDNVDKFEFDIFVVINHTAHLHEGIIHCLCIVIIFKWGTAESESVIK